MILEILKQIAKRLKSSQFWIIILSSMATALGGFGGLPSPPPIFLDLAKNVYVQWILMFILILQGGSGFDVIYAGISTLLTFAIYKVASLIPVQDIKEVGKDSIKKIKESIDKLPTSVEFENFSDPDSDTM